jgi:signal transduction histidine kinase
MIQELKRVPLLAVLSDEELRAWLFEPFYTARGAGLDISYQIAVGRHGGDPRVVSEPGDTRFRVRLPLVANGGAG